MTITAWSGGNITRVLRTSDWRRFKCAILLPVLSDPATLEDQLGILKQIKDFVDLNRSELQSAYLQRPLGSVAWLARNLLELAIWSEHCAASKENAKEFLLDSARDACDGLKIPDGPLLHGSLEPTRQRLDRECRR